MLLITDIGRLSLKNDDGSGRVIMVFSIGFGSDGSPPVSRFRFQSLLHPVAVVGSHVVQIRLKRFNIQDRHYNVCDNVLGRICIKEKSSFVLDSSYFAANIKE